MACPRGHHGWDVEGRVMTRGAHEGGGGLCCKARRPDNMGTPFPMAPPLSAKYRNNDIVSPIPCSLPFYTTIAFKSYIPLTFSERMFLYPVHVYMPKMFFLGRGEWKGPPPATVLQNVRNTYIVRINSLRHM